jgi:hypothetical protein
MTEDPTPAEEREIERDQDWRDHMAAARAKLAEVTERQAREKSTDAG